MKYRPLGKSNLKVSEISFGCWTMGGLNWVDGIANGWANVDEEEITRGIKAALDAGVNHFDNADVYGNGRAERMLARVLDRLGVKSDSVIIATKVGHFPGTAAHAYEPLHIRHQCEQSLRNLKRDVIDIYYLHHGNFGPNDEYLAGAAETLDALVKEGKVRVKGQSAYSVEDFEKTIPVVRPEVLQSFAHALDDRFIREGSPLQELMTRHCLSFVAFSPLAQGRLLDKYDPANPPVFEPGDNRKNRETFSAAAIAALKPKLEKLKRHFGCGTETLAAVALNYVLGHPNVACVIPGFRNERQARCNVGAIQRPLEPEDLDFIRQALA